MIQSHRPQNRSEVEENGLIFYNIQLKMVDWLVLSSIFSFLINGKKKDLKQEWSTHCII